MCGILTIIDKNGINLTKAKKCLKILEKRGPDYNHYNLFDNKIFLGQTVLEIVGEYDKSNYVSNSKIYHLVFNGKVNSKRTGARIPKSRPENPQIWALGRPDPKSSKFFDFFKRNDDDFFFFF